MTLKQLTFPLFALIVLSSCSSTKNAGNEELYKHTWELEYITGTRIAFDGLFPDKKPYLNFEKSTNMVTGNAGCNGYSSDYKLKGNSLTFGEKGISTMMYCGEGEQQFLNMLKKINSYSIDKDGKLNLWMDEVPMMRFYKKQ